MLKRFAVLLPLCILPLSSVADEESPVVELKRLKMETALTVAKSTVDACRKEGYQVAVTVVDRTGQAQIILRDTFAPHFAVKVSEQKAYTASSFNSATSQLTKRFTSPFSPAKLDGIITSGGGVPITAAGSLLGAVGVSGAPSGEIDEKCAKAGINAVIDDLEMM